MDSSFIILPNMYLSFLSWQEYIGINDYSFEMENQKSDSQYILIEIFESNIWDNILENLELPSMFPPGIFIKLKEYSKVWKISSILYSY